MHENVAGGPYRPYKELLNRPHVLPTFVLALVGRLTFGILPLILLFSVRQATGSFTVGALSGALFGVGTLALPFQAA